MAWRHFCSWAAVVLLLRDVNMFKSNRKQTHHFSQQTKWSWNKKLTNGFNDTLKLQRFVGHNLLLLFVWTEFISTLFKLIPFFFLGFCQIADKSRPWMTFYKFKETEQKGPSQVLNTGPSRCDATCAECCLIQSNPNAFLGFWDIIIGSSHFFVWHFITQTKNNELKKKRNQQINMN